MKVADSALLASGRYFDGINWTGSNAFFNYGDLLTVQNTIICGVNGQSNPEPPTPGHPNAKSFIGAGFMISNNYPDHTDWPSQNPKLQAANVHVFGWPAPVGNFLGQPQSSVPNVTVHPNPLNVNADPLIAQAIAGTVDARGAINQLRQAGGLPPI